MVFNPAKALARGSRPKLFKNGRHFVAWIGLTPWIDQTSNGLPISGTSTFWPSAAAMNLSGVWSMIGKVP